LSLRLVLAIEEVARSDQVLMAIMCAVALTADRFASGPGRRCGNVERLRRRTPGSISF